MTNEVLSERERQVLEHLDRAQSLGVTSPGDHPSL
jgi:hypothetical protein